MLVNDSGADQGRRVAVASAEEEEHANPVQIRLSPRPVSLPGPFGGFDLHDISPEVRQNLDGGGALQEVREAKDLYPVQHRLSGPFREWRQTVANKSPIPQPHGRSRGPPRNAARVSRRKPEFPRHSPP